MDEAIRSSLKESGKILISFLPLFSFWFISLGHSMIRLQIGTYTGSALLIVMVFMRLSRGMIMWGMAIYFAIVLIFALWLKNVFVIQYQGVLPGAILFIVAMLSMIVGRPFVQDYAREGIAQEQQESVQFVRSCFKMTSFWASIFLLSALINRVKMNDPNPDEFVYFGVQLGILLIAMGYTTVYMIWSKHKRLSMPKT